MSQETINILLNTIADLKANELKQAYSQMGEDIANIELIEIYEYIDDMKLEDTIAGLIKHKLA